MTDKQLPEAPASINFKVVDKEGFNYQITLRDFSENALMGRVKAIRSWLVEQDFVAPGKQPAGNGSQNTPVPLPTEAAPATEQSLMFDAERLVGSTSGDKTYFKVQGGKFSKFGVNIWPEVLEAAGFNPDQLDPKTTYDLTGYTAYYTLKDNGKEDKVVNLSKEA